MTKHNPENERIKHKYLAYLKEARGLSEPTLDAVAKALRRFEEYTLCKPFKAFHYQQACAFKRHLANQTGKRSGERLSKATLHATLKHLKAFFFWLAGQPGYKARLQYSDSDYFHLSEKDTRIASAQRERESPSVEQVRHVIQSMPIESEIERRDRALVAFVLLTGARVSAIASLKLKHVDAIAGCVHQDGREVKTKFGKTFDTFFLPVGEDVQQIVIDWVRFLWEEKLWGNDDPLFPATQIALGASRQFEVAGLARKHWSTATPIRKIFLGAFKRAGLPYFHPHSLRSTLGKLGQTVCKSHEALKAWSQNLGHEKVLTTLMSYGKVATERQGEIIRELAVPQPSVQPVAKDLAKQVAQELLAAGVTLPTGQQNS